MSVLSYLPGRMQRVVQRHAHALKYHRLWAKLLRRAARERIPARSLSRVHLFLRSHYDKKLIPHADPLQNPATGYFPGLRARALWQSSEIAWTALLEQAYPQIKREYVNMTSKVKLTPHPQSDDETSWRVRYFYLLGEEQAEAHQLCRKLLRPSKAASQQDPATRCLPGPHCPALWCREYTSDLPPRTGCDTGLRLKSEFGSRELAGR
jgi:hypothetical protein